MDSFPSVPLLIITMKLRTQLHIFFIAGVIIISGPTFAQKKWAGIVLYNIDHNGITGNMVVDPVVRISKGKFSYPAPIPPDTWDKPDATKILGSYFDRYCKEEYPKGRKFEIFVDGNRCGYAKVTELDSIHSCSPVISEVSVSYTDSAVLHFIDHGLAIAGLPPRRTIRKFSVDSLLEDSLYKYAKLEFIRRGVKKEYAKDMQVREIRAVDLNGDGKPKYLVSYLINGESVKRTNYDGNIQYSLVMILEPSPGGFTQLFSHYPDPAIPEETHTSKFVDVIDLDGDGICEIVIQQVFYMKNWDYVLLKKKGDIWEQVYEGAGGGC